MLFRPGLYNLLIPYGALGVYHSLSEPPGIVRFTPHYWLVVDGPGLTPPDQPLGLPVSQLWYTPNPGRPPFVSVLPVCSVVTVDEVVETETGGLVCLPTHPCVWLRGWESAPVGGLGPKVGHVLPGAPFLFFQCSFSDPTVSQ